MLANQFAAIIAQHLAGPIVHERESALGFDHINEIGRGVDHITVGAFGQFELIGDVAVGLAQPALGQDVIDGFEEVVLAEWLA